MNCVGRYLCACARFGIIKVPNDATRTQGTVPARCAIESERVAFRCAHNLVEEARINCHLEVNSSTEKLRVARTSDEHPVSGIEFAPVEMSILASTLDSGVLNVFGTLPAF